MEDEEEDGSRAQAADLLASLLHLLASVAAGVPTARVAVLRSAHALHLLRRAAFVPFTV